MNESLKYYHFCTYGLQSGNLPTQGVVALLSTQGRRLSMKVYLEETLAT